jgi:hypothetical protein
MPVKPLIRINDGWKHDENKRFGGCVVGVIEAYNAETGAMKVFHYAPDISHCLFLRDLADAVETVDKHHKAILQLKTDLEGQDYQEGGCKP